MQRRQLASTMTPQEKPDYCQWYLCVISIGMAMSLEMGESTAQSQDRRERRRAVQQQTVRQQQTTQLAQTEAMRFEIPPQPLPPALVQFSQVTQIELFFDAALARGLYTQGISGTYAPEQALQQL